MQNKRIFGLAVLMLLSMIVTGGLWAQLKLDGVVSTGLGLLGSTYGEQQTVVKPFSVADEVYGFRLRLNGNYTNDEGTAGIRFRIQANSRVDYGYLAMPIAAGWVKFFNKKLDVSAGIIEDSTWTPGDWWLFSDHISVGLGGLAKIVPVDGLTLGFGAFTLSTQSSSNNSVLRIGGSNMANFNEDVLSYGDVKYTYHILYNLPDIFRFSASFRWKNKAGMQHTPTQLLTADYTANDFYTVGRHENSVLNGDIRLLMNKNLTAIVAYQFENMHQFDRNGNVRISETFGYKFGNLSFGLNMWQYLYFRQGDFVSAQGDFTVKPKEEKVKMDPSLMFNLWGSYAIGKIVPRLDLNFLIGGQSMLAGSNDVWNNAQWSRRGFNNFAVPSEANRKRSVFSLRPSIKINVDARTAVEIGDMINYDFADFDGAYADLNDKTKRNQISNAFYLDLKWTF